MVVIKASKGLALLMLCAVVVATFTLVNSFTDGTVKIVFLLLPTVIILTGVSLFSSCNKRPGV